MERHLWLVNENSSPPLADLKIEFIEQNQFVLLSGGKLERWNGFRFPFSFRFDGRSKDKAGIAIHLKHLVLESLVHYALEKFKL